MLWRSCEGCEECLALITDAPLSDWTSEAPRIRGVWGRGVSWRGSIARHRCTWCRSRRGKVLQPAQTSQTSRVTTGCRAVVSANSLQGWTGYLRTSRCGDAALACVNSPWRTGLARSHGNDTYCTSGTPTTSVARWLQIFIVTSASLDDCAENLVNSSSGFNLIFLRQWQGSTLLVQSH